MKKILFAAIVSIAFISCQKKDDLPSAPVTPAIETISFIQIDKDGKETILSTVHP